MLRTVLADQLEFHEESSNAREALSIGGEVVERGEVMLVFSEPAAGTGLNFACRVRSDDAHIEGLVDDATALRAVPDRRIATPVVHVLARGVAPRERDRSSIHQNAPHPACASSAIMTQNQCSTIADATLSERSRATPAAAANTRPPRNGTAGCALPTNGSASAIPEDCSTDPHVA